MTSRKGWAANALEVEQRRLDARDLVGSRLARVRYIVIDYFGWEVLGRDPEPRRVITSADEWARAPWRRGDRHTIDFAVELELTDGNMFAVTWDLPGDTESLNFAPGSAQDAMGWRSQGAIWDVSEEQPWASLLGHPVERVDLDYEPWGDRGAFWNTRAVMRAGGTSVQFLLADLDIEGRLIVSADNVVVVPGEDTPSEEIRAWLGTSSRHK